MIDWRKQSWNSSHFVCMYVCVYVCVGVPELQVTYFSLEIYFWVEWMNNPTSNWCPDEVIFIGGSGIEIRKNITPSILIKHESRLSTCPRFIQPPKVPASWTFGSRCHLDQLKTWLSPSVLFIHVYAIFVLFVFTYLYHYLFFYLRRHYDGAKCSTTT